jgi:hypothetical protein
MPEQKNTEEYKDENGACLVICELGRLTAAIDCD